MKSKAIIPEWIKKAIKNKKQRIRRYMKKYNVPYDLADKKTTFEWSAEDDNEMMRQEMEFCNGR